MTSPQSWSYQSLLWLHAASPSSSIWLEPRTCSQKHTHCCIPSPGPLLSRNCPGYSEQMNWCKHPADRPILGVCDTVACQSWHVFACTPHRNRMESGYSQLNTARESGELERGGNVKLKRVKLAKLLFFQDGILSHSAKERRPSAATS